MNIKNRKPGLVPKEHWDEIGTLSKAALMDMVYDYALQENNDNPMEAFRARCEIIISYRAKVTP